MSQQEKEIRAKVTEIYEKNRSAKARYVANIGGARSSKSYSIAQLLIEKLINEDNKKFLVTRKTMPALRLTAYKLTCDLLKEYGIYSRCFHNKSQNILEIKNNFMLFTSVDDPEKIKSTEWNYVWMEEANEFTWNDFIILETRLSGKTIPQEPNHIYMSLNPVDEFGWINQKLVMKKGEKIKVIHSSYKDNPFLDKSYIEILEELKDEDLNYWRIYGLGEWGALQNIIYRPYIMETEWPKEFDEVIYGLDFGFNHPSVLLEIGFKDEEIWLTEKIYKTHLTNTDLIEEMKKQIPEEFRTREMYADAAEPARIEDIFGAGFNIKPAIKGPKSVKDGIDICKSQKFHTRAENINLNKERQSYKYKEDKNGNVIEDPVKFFDDAMDAKRYAVYSHLKGAMPNLRWV